MNILLPFFDDSTLFLAIKTYHALLSYGNYNIIFFCILKKGKLTDRQLELLNDSYVVYKESIDYFYDAKFLSNFDLVIFSRLPDGKFDKKRIINAHTYFINKRPYFLSMVSGIDFTPEQGIKNRCHADGICIPDDSTILKYDHIINKSQDICKYHPFFCMVSDTISTSRPIQNIYFFAQAVMPDTLSERINIVLMLCELAEKYKDKNIFIKLRHLKGENSKHKHQEIFSYEDIIKICAAYRSIPTNLVLCIKTMEECLHDADFCITCNSTAGIESLCAGIPTAFYLDFLSNERIVKESKSYFQKSGLLYSKKDILNLIIKTPNKQWVKEKLCTIGDLENIFKSIQIFNDHYMFNASEYYKEEYDDHIDINKCSRVIKIEYYLVKICSPRKLKKFLLNRKKFFIDSHNIIVSLYWRIIGSKNY